MFINYNEKDVPQPQDEVALGLIKGAREYFDVNKDELFGKKILIKYEIKKVPGAFEIPF